MPLKPVNQWNSFVMICKLNLLTITTLDTLTCIFGQSAGVGLHCVHLCRRVRLSQQVSWMGQWTIWWWGSSNAGDLGNAEYHFIAIAPRSTLAWSGSTWSGPIYGYNRTKLSTYAKLKVWKRTILYWNFILMLNWITWNRTVLKFKLRTYAKLNCLK